MTLGGPRFPQDPYEIGANPPTPVGPLQTLIVDTGLHFLGPIAADRLSRCWIFELVKAPDIRRIDPGAIPTTGILLKYY